MPNRFEGRKSERGVSLVSVMLFVGILGIVVATEIRRRVSAGKLLDANTGKLVDINKLKQARQDLAKTMGAYLSAPLIIQQSESLAENSPVLACLYASSAAAGTCAGSSNVSKYHPFFLRPPSAFAFPPDKGPAAKPNKNCPDESTKASDISCYLGGQRADGAKVGYNKYGETGTLSSDFPFEVKLWYNPNCGATPDSSGNYACALADTLTFAFQIVHHIFDAKDVDLGVGPLGRFPQSPRLSTMARSLITGQQCHTGAYLVGFDKNGNPQCECKAPYTQTGADELGPVCTATSATPSSPSPNPTKLTVTQTFSFDNMTKRPSPSPGITCPNNGAVVDMHVGCTMQQTSTDYDYTDYAVCGTITSTCKLKQMIMTSNMCFEYGGADCMCYNVISSCSKMDTAPTVTCTVTATCSYSG